MKKSLTLLVAAIALACVAQPAAAEPKNSPPNANGNKYQCFSGTVDGGFNGTCTVNADGTATLDTIDGDLDPNNAYAGVYLQNSNLSGKRLRDVNQLAFSYSGTGEAGGSPRLSIPIDENGDGTTEAYAFIDTLGCNDGAGTLDAINDATCNVYYGAAAYPNWAAFASANPQYRISQSLTFVIVDQPGTFTVSNIRLGKGPAKPA